jgi:hypothetical protein
MEACEGLESKEVKGKGKNKYSSRKKKQNKETYKKSFKDVNRERQCTNQP